MDRRQTTRRSECRPNLTPHMRRSANFTKGRRGYRGERRVGAINVPWSMRRRGSDFEHITASEIVANMERAVGRCLVFGVGYYYDPSAREAFRQKASKAKAQSVVTESDVRVAGNAFSAARRVHCKALAEEAKWAVRVRQFDSLTPDEMQKAISEL